MGWGCTVSYTCTALHCYSSSVSLAYCVWLSQYKKWTLLNNTAFFKLWHYYYIPIVVSQGTARLPAARMNHSANCTEWGRCPLQAQRFVMWIRYTITPHFCTMIIIGNSSDACLSSGHSIAESVSVYTVGSHQTQETELELACTS